MSTQPGHFNSRQHPPRGTFCTRAGLAALCVFIVTAVVFFYEAVFQAKVFAARDHYLFFMPRRFFALDTLLEGSLPLWNPLNACGVPFLANVQSSVLYPLSAIFYLLPFPTGYNAFIILHYILAALFMYALMRHWNSSPFAAAFAGLVFAFSGYMQSINDNLAFLTSATWLPLIVLCFSCALRDRAPLWAIAAALLVGLQVLAGDASFCIVSTMLCTALYALCAPDSGIKHIRTRTGWWLVVWSVGLLLAAVVLLPFFEYVRLSDRAGGLAAEEALHWSLHPLELLQFVHPYIFGRLVPDVRWFGQRWLDTVYIGIFPLCFSAFYLLRCRCRHKLFLAVTALLGLFLALGSYNPLLSFSMQHIPALRLMQYPVKFMLLCAFGLAVMSGRGAEEFLNRMQQRSSIRGILKPLLLPVCLLLAILLAGAAGRDALFDLFSRVYPATDYFAPLRDARFFELYRGVFFTALLCGAFAVLALCAIRFRHRSALVCTLIGIVLCLDLYLLGAPGDPWLERQAVCRPGTVVAALKQDDSPYRIYSLARIAGGGSYSHTPYMSFDTVYRMLAQLLPPNLHLYHNLASVDEYAEMLHVRYYEIFARVLLHLAGISDDPHGNEYCRTIFSLLNVKYIISPYALPDLRFELVRDGPLRIYRNPDVLPRAYFAGHILACTDDDDVLDRIHAPGFDITAACMPESELARLPAHQRTALMHAVPQEHFRRPVIEQYTANRVVITAETENHSLLVLSDTWFPGWRALVNGSRRPLLRVNHALRGVVLEPGSSRIEFVYRPFSFAAGLAVSATTLLALLAAALWLLRRRAASPHGGTTL